MQGNGVGRRAEGGGHANGAGGDGQKRKEWQMERQDAGLTPVVSEWGEGGRGRRAPAGARVGASR